MNETTNLDGPAALQQAASSLGNVPREDGTPSPVLPFLPPLVLGAVVADLIVVDRRAYRDLCARRWGGPALQDAWANLADWNGELRGSLVEALRVYHRNPYLEDLNETIHNPAGTLTDFLWKLQAAWQPDRSRLRPLLDFEETFQVCFLRRGLVFWCGLVLDQLRGKADAVGISAANPEARHV